MSSPVLQSQTSEEHTDLVEYECNLASCYEAEYRLSLKLQEDFKGRRNWEDAIATYCDDYEVLGTPNCCVEQEGVGTQETNGMDTEYSSRVTTKSFHDMALPIITDSSQFAAEAMDCGVSIYDSSHCDDDHLTNPLSNFSPRYHCIDNEAYLFRGNVHSEGPSMKRLCLDQEDKS